MVGQCTICARRPTNHVGTETARTTPFFARRTTAEHDHSIAVQDRSTGRSNTPRPCFLTQWETTRVESCRERGLAELLVHKSKLFFMELFNVYLLSLERQSVEYCKQEEQLQMPVDVSVHRLVMIHLNHPSLISSIPVFWVNSP
jgi:hypothetical protein